MRTWWGLLLAVDATTAVVSVVDPGSYGRWRFVVGAAGRVWVLVVGTGFSLSLGFASLEFVSLGFASLGSFTSLGFVRVVGFFVVVGIPVGVGVLVVVGVGGCIAVVRF